jgi:hypothetical protein
MLKVRTCSCNSFNESGHHEECMAQSVSYFRSKCVLHPVTVLSRRIKSQAFIKAVVKCSGITAGVIHYFSMQRTVRFSSFEVIEPSLKFSWSIDQDISWIHRILRIIALLNDPPMQSKWKQSTHSHPVFLRYI